ncbi:hypothetical protein B0H16DRAFT_1477186 [Mycena metata]|uniref:Reverse transcriptase zinc-binding domain-containing protein n=1 Tax=Mycena metata TaxID=1033252 RepID=A0AAD7HA51_9AGAR|nr:hypothetical protein B0H16DRAFT_1477186 [Mycena metata]
MALRVTENSPQTSQRAEIASTLIVVQQTARDQALIIYNSKGIIGAEMIQRLQAREDRGWIGVADRDLLQVLAVELKTVDRDSQEYESVGRKEALALAKEGCQRPEEILINLEIDPAQKLRGAKLSTLTQATACAGIKERREPVMRKATENNIKLIAASVQQIFSYQPTPVEIWKSIRHRDFSRQVKNFLWKSIHSAHRIGIFWKHIPECGERATCNFCNETEDLEHVLIKCKRPGRAQIWALAKDLWLRKHDSWLEPSLGGVLGCGLATFHGKKGKVSLGLARLYRILVSESIFVLWKVRNDTVISRNGEPPPENMIHNKWLQAINLRLTFDRILTNHAKYGKQNSIRSSVVLQTWSSTLLMLEFHQKSIASVPRDRVALGLFLQLNEESLPGDWIKQPGFLVGIEPKSSHPPSQPTGRRGMG